jgi:hypothetical protein
VIYLGGTYPKIAAPAVVKAPVSWCRRMTRVPAAECYILKCAELGRCAAAWAYWGCELLPVALSPSHSLCDSVPPAELLNMDGLTAGHSPGRSTPGRRNWGGG